MRSEKIYGVRLAAVAILAACVSVPVASAGVNMDLEFLWSPKSDDSTQVYMHVSNMAWEPERSQVRKVYPKLRHPEWDFPVLVFMAQNSGKSLNAVWKLRAQGLSWSVVMGRLGIPRERLVVELRREPTPRGKAHGYWRKHSPRGAALTDDDIYYWVNVHALSRYFETDPSIIVALREDGRTFKAVAAHSFKAGQGKAKMHNNKRVQSAGVNTPPEKARSRNEDRGKRKNNRKD